MQCIGTCLQIQMQIEADQQLAALRQQSRPSMQREWANASMGSLRPAYGQHTNGQGSLDGHASHDGVVILSQNGSPMDDSPPNQSHVSGTRGVNTHLALAMFVQGVLASARGLVFRHHTSKMSLSGSHHASLRMWSQHSVEAVSALLCTAVTVYDCLPDCTHASYM